MRITLSRDEVNRRWTTVVSLQLNGKCFSLVRDCLEMCWLEKKTVGCATVCTSAVNFPCKDVLSVVYMGEGRWASTDLSSIHCANLSGKKKATQWRAHSEDELIWAMPQPIERVEGMIGQQLREWPKLRITFHWFDRRRESCPTIRLLERTTVDHRRWQEEGEKPFAKATSIWRRDFPAGVSLSKKRSARLKDVKEWCGAQHIVSTNSLTGSTCHANRSAELFSRWQVQIFNGEQRTSLQVTSSSFQRTTNPEINVRLFQ